MRVSATTVIYPAGEIEDAVRHIGGAGFEGIELQGHHVHWLLERRERERELQRLLEDAGLQVSAAMYGYLDSPTSLEEYVSVVRLAARFGARTVPVLPPRRGDADRGLFLGLLETLSEQAADLGVRIAVHHHLGTVVDTPKEIDDFLDAAVHNPQLGLLIDTAHLALHGAPIADHLRRWREAVAHVHVKDLKRDLIPHLSAAGPRDAQGAFRVPGDGDLDFTAIAEALDVDDDDVWLSLEIETFHRPPLDALSVGRTFIEGAFA